MSILYPHAKYQTILVHTQWYTSNKSVKHLKNYEYNYENTHSHCEQ